MKTQRMMVNLISDDLAASKSFYQELFGFEVKSESDWFVQLVSDSCSIELGLIVTGHEIIPKNVSTQGAGFYLTFVVQDVRVTQEAVKSGGYEIIQQPELTPYGQLRMLLRSPEGCVIDVSSPFGDAPNKRLDGSFNSDSNN